MNNFIPEKGQFFWYVEEVINEELGFPDLEILSDKFDPSKHYKLVENNNCYLTEQDAYDSLL
tara:strand:+ start:3941 stop:4126 length:186 start_codon:yes stop_codon:yes gene_type:complete